MTVQAASATPAPSADPTGEGSPPDLSNTGALPTGASDAGHRTTAQSDRMARALGVLTGGGKKPDPVAPAAEPAPAPEPAEMAPLAAGPEATPAELPEQRPGESDAKYEARLARALADIQKEQGEKLLLKKQLADRDTTEGALKADLEALRARLAKIEADPAEALRAAKTTYDEYTKKILAGEVKAPTPEDELARKVDEKSSELERRLADMQAKLEAKEKAEQEAALKRQYEETRSRDLEIVKARIQAAAEKHPLVASLSWSAERVLDLCYQEQTNDIEGQLAKLDAAASSDLETLLQSPRALAAVLKRSPKIRETIQAAIAGGKDQSRQTPKSSEGPRALGADVVSAPTTPIDRPKTKEEKRRSALRILSGEG